MSQAEDGEASGRAKELEITRLSIADMKAGRSKPAEEMLAEMRQVLDAKRFNQINPK
jgi:hypothetical protein